MIVPKTDLTLSDLILRPDICTSEPRQNTLALDLSIVKCYNCKQLGYFASSCSEPRKANLKEIKEDKGELVSKKKVEKEVL